MTGVQTCALPISGTRTLLSLFFFSVTFLPPYPIFCFDLFLAVRKEPSPKNRRKATLESLSRFLSEKAQRGGILLSDKTPLPQEGEQFWKEGTESRDRIQKGPQRPNAFYTKAGGRAASANCTNFPVRFYYTCFIPFRQAFLFCPPFQTWDKPSLSTV